jgi:hypothetical protein
VPEVLPDEGDKAGLPDRGIRTETLIGKQSYHQFVNIPLMKNPGRPEAPDIGLF